MGYRIDIIGKKFDRLLVLELVSVVEGYKSKYKCICDCGKEAIKWSHHLKYRAKVSCTSCGRAGRKYDSKKPYETTSFNKMYNQYIGNAKKSNRVFELDKESFRVITKLNCFYCNEIPSIRYSKKLKDSYVCNGIDRVDNSKGYTLDNSVPCCVICNLAKRSLSIKEFFNWVERISNNKDALCSKLLERENNEKTT